MSASPRAGDVPRQARRDAMRIQLLVYPGFDELDALAPFEVLHSAAQLGARFTAELVALDAATVISARGVEFRIGSRLDRQRPPELLIVPGGGWNDRAERGAWAEARRGEIPALLARLHASGTALAAVCTGTMLLAAAGLLKGRPATTHHGAEDELRAAGAEVIHARVVDDGDILTCGGVTSGLDLALWLTELHGSAAVASLVERELDHERRGTVWSRGERGGMRAAG